MEAMKLIIYQSLISYQFIFLFIRLFCGLSTVDIKGGNGRGTCIILSCNRESLLIKVWLQLASLIDFLSVSSTFGV